MNLFWRSNLAILALVLVVVAAGDLYSWRVVRDQARDAGFQQLAAIGRVARLDRPDLSPDLGSDFGDDSALRRWLGEMQAAGVQAAVLSRDGRVLEQSASGPGQEPADAQEAEIQQAFANGEGRSMRRNNALHRDFLYYAISYPNAPGASPGLIPANPARPAKGDAAKEGSPDKDGNDSFVLRLALPLPDVDRQFAATRRPVWTAFLVLLASAILISLIDAHNLSRRIGSLG